MGYNYQDASRESQQEYFGRANVSRMNIEEREKTILLQKLSDREKRIAELERKLEQTEKDLTDYQFNYPKIKDLEKENGKLLQRIIQLEKDVTENESDCSMCDFPKLKQDLEKENAELKEQLEKETVQRIYNLNKSIEWKEKHRRLKKENAELKKRNGELAGQKANLERWFGEAKDIIRNLLSVLGSFLYDITEMSEFAQKTIKQAENFLKE